MEYEQDFRIYILGKLSGRVLVGAPDECWPWIGTTNANGYGVVTYTWKRRRTSMTASRAVAIAHGLVTVREQDALHSCDNPPCCNQAHLRAGDQADNMADATDRGRRAKTYRPHTRVRKLSDDDVRAIRADDRDAFAVAKDYGCGYVTIYNIKARRRKAGIPDVV